MNGSEQRIGGRTQLFCVLGHPVAHSLSPAMQNAALRAMGIDGVYVAFDVAPDRLDGAVRGLEALGVIGANCTIPHKERACSLVEELTEEARLVGAVNTIAFRDGRRIGHNTDAPGFLADLRARGVEPLGKRVVVLGAGGSARAVVFALAGAGAAVIIANRSRERAEELAAAARALGSGEVETVPLESGALVEAARDAELLVNTTSLGMSPSVDAMPPVPEDCLLPSLFVYDLIYNPLETRLLRTARIRGARGTHGAGMLARQGALALEFWTGQPAPAALMEQVVLEELGHREQRQPDRAKSGALCGPSPEVRARQDRQEQ